MAFLELNLFYKLSDIYRIIYINIQFTQCKLFPHEKSGLSYLIEVSIPPVDRDSRGG